MSDSIRPQVTAQIPGVEDFLRYCERVKVNAKTFIFRQGDDSEFLYLILDGSVSVLVDDEEHPEMEMLVSYLNPGDFVGEMGLFGEHKRSANLLARTDVTLARISYDRFHQVRGEFPEVLYALANQLGYRLRNTTRKLTDLAFVDVAGRISKTLLELTDQPDAMTHPDGMQIRITRQDLGKLVGCSREMAGRVLKALQEQGLIDVSGKTIVVLREPRQSQAPLLVNDG
ncbi:transcriptional regulator Vfr [Luminiphilus syltensis NOR5-1B]|uniref:Transcriptional regulator Vfr n=1 Tax=Luminiphilus syltensis NOR5-1B TaxID=565045 RepID=B8KVZ7_9GAMM|nr:cAMP-activated global transcriptional regulator CRP [Luminiphilus syltensis]EED36285.1 transcriptional regulator Vfr [Luminiphilus syltensis NOR5-1B]